MSRHLEDTDDWDKGCNCHRCGCGGSDGPDDWNDGGDDADDWSDDGDDASSIPCPYCGQEVYEDSPRCPHCGRYISEEDAPPRRLPWWIVLGVVLCLCAIVVWIIGF